MPRDPTGWSIGYPDWVISREPLPIIQRYPCACTTSPRRNAADKPRQHRSRYGVSVGRCNTHRLLKVIVGLQLNGAGPGCSGNDDHRLSREEAEAGVTITPTVAPRRLVPRAMLILSPLWIAEIIVEHDDGSAVDPRGELLER